MYEDLNKIQREAVEHTEGAVLVFAGAGSGKTRVLTYRIANLIQNHQVNPYNILAVTFTNKAANEIKDRIASLMGTNIGGIWAGTFHGTCCRILREHGADMGLDRNFVIYDDGDQLSIIKEALDTLGYDPKRYPARVVLNLISNAKEGLVTPENFHKKYAGDIEGVAGDVYKIYQEQLDLNNALDFDDLIMKAVVLLQNYPTVLEHYQEKFRYVLVDEYQDINMSQYLLIRLLSGKYNNVFCVGDDDQSIYRWRGAQVGIILQFERDYPKATVYKLEQNYRSTKNILAAAHAVVAKNTIRAEKKLWTENGAGDLIDLISSANDVDEANNVARAIYEQVEFGTRKYSDFAILYRMNSQSRAFEESLINRRIPYKIVGSVRFYERKEIKDIIAYLRLAANPYDSVSFKRVINAPLRGIGLTTVSKLEIFADANSKTLYETASDIENVPTISTRTKNLIAGFTKMIDRFHELAGTAAVYELTEEILNLSGYVTALQSERSSEAQSRLENIEELLSVIKSYSETTEADATLGNFLEQVALISDIDSYEDATNAVTLMTLHAAKGLEFPVVYMVGMEESIFPHARSLDDPEELEEERRLCYVGMTRAKEKLVLSYAHQRMIMGKIERTMPSRFLADVPKKLFSSPVVTAQEKTESDMVWKRVPISRTVSKPSFNVGSKVMHDKFGRGVVLMSTGSGDMEQVTILFDGVGKKELLVSIAKNKMHVV